MADTIEIVQGTATTVEVAGPTGPQGPAGAAGATGAQGPQGVPGTGLEVLTTQGDLLYQGASTGQRLPIGTTGQVLKVSGGIPSWANESGAVTSVNGATGAVTITPASIDAANDNHTHDFSDINVNGVLISGAGNADANGSYLYSGDFGDRGAYHKDKDSLIYWDGTAWLINVNGADRYGSTQNVSFPYQVTSWSVLPGTGTAPAPTSNARLSGQEFEEIVGQRINPTLRGTAATKDAPATGNASSAQVVLGNDTRLSDARTPTSHTHPASAISDSTTAGRALLTGADAAAQRTSLGLGTAATSASSAFAAASHTHSASDITSGLAASATTDTTNASNISSGTLAAARLSVGTTTGTVAAGDDSRFHTRSHTLTSTSDHTASNWSVFYSNGSGQVTELGLGASGQVLQSNGATSAPSFAATSGGGATNLWVPASAWIPRTTTGCGVDSREQATNKVNTDELLFDTATEEYAQALVVMPSNYNNSTVTARFYWTAASGSGGVAWGLRGRAYSDDDALDAAQGTGQVVTDTFITANDMHVTSATSAITLAGTPAANRPVQYEVYRVVANASDTLGVDARLLGVEIIFN